MYENLHDFESMYRSDRERLTGKLEVCRKLKASRIRQEVREGSSRLFLLLLAFKIV